MLKISCIKNQNILKNKSKSESLFDVDNSQFICQKCRQVWITERISPKGLENPFELWTFSNCRPLNYGKEIVRGS